MFVMCGMLGDLEGVDLLGVFGVDGLRDCWMRGIDYLGILQREGWVEDRWMSDSTLAFAMFLLMCCGMRCLIVCTTLWNVECRR